MERRLTRLDGLVRAGVIPSHAQATLLEQIRDGGWRLFRARGSTWWLETEGAPPLLVHHKVAAGALASGWLSKLLDDAERYAEEHTITMAGQQSLSLRKRWEAGS